MTFWSEECQYKKKRLKARQLYPMLNGIVERPIVLYYPFIMEHMEQVPFWLLNLSKSCKPITIFIFLPIFMPLSFSFRPSSLQIKKTNSHKKKMIKIKEICKNESF